MRRSSELKNFQPANFERCDEPRDQLEISQYLGELIGRHHDLSLIAGPDDIETLRDMRRVEAEIKMTQFSLRYPDYHAV